METINMNPAKAVTILSTALAISTPCSQVLADDWANWRGPQRNGQSRETGLLKEWPKEGPKLVWQLKDVGSGYGSPTIVGTVIYLISNIGNDNEYVQALNAADGKKLWTTTIGKVGNPNQVPNYAGSRSTPIVDGSLLYALGSDGDLACLDRSTGALKWKKSLRNDFGGQPGVWAYSESPLIDGDALICTPGGNQATIVALNKKTGDVIWKSAVPEGDQAGYASVVAADIGGSKQYVQFLQKGVIGVDAKTGKYLWRYDGTAKGSMANIPTPIVHDSQVYTGTGMTGGGLALVVSRGGSYTAEPKYFGKKMPNAIGGAVKVGDYLYGATSASLMCVDFASGAVKWDERSVGPASMVVADGRIYLHGENGEVAMIEATPDGYREKGRFTPPDQPERARTKAWAYPALANGRLYIRDLNCLWCYDVKGEGK
jgi:outer membrane protein assembly factor BamB